MGAEQFVSGTFDLDMAGRLHQPDLQQLFGVIPLVDSRVDVQPFITLQTDQRCVKPLGQHFGDLCFADPGFSFEKKRAFELEGQVDRGGQTAVADVVLFDQSVVKFVDRMECGQARQRTAPEEDERGAGGDAKVGHTRRLKNRRAGQTELLRSRKWMGQLSGF